MNDYRMVANWLQKNKHIQYSNTYFVWWDSYESKQDCEWVSSSVIGSGLINHQTRRNHFISFLFNIDFLTCFQSQQYLNMFVQFLQFIDLFDARHRSILQPILRSKSSGKTSVWRWLQVSWGVTLGFCFLYAVCMLKILYEPTTSYQKHLQTSLFLICCFVVISRMLRVWNIDTNIYSPNGLDVLGNTPCIEQKHVFKNSVGAIFDEWFNPQHWWINFHVCWLNPDHLMTRNSMSTAPTGYPCFTRNMDTTIAAPSSVPFIHLRMWIIWYKVVLPRGLLRLVYLH